MMLLTGAVLLSSLVGSDRPASMATFTDVYVKIMILYVLILNLVDSTKKISLFYVVIVSACAGLGAYALHAKITGTATIEGSRAALVGHSGGAGGGRGVVDAVARRAAGDRGGGVFSVA
jgi:hypothetical protein